MSYEKQKARHIIVTGFLLSFRRGTGCPALKLLMAEVVRDIYKMALEGKGNETIARRLQERGILVPQVYWRLSTSRHNKRAGRGLLLAFGL